MFLLIRRLKHPESLRFLATPSGERASPAFKRVNSQSPSACYSKTVEDCIEIRKHFEKHSLVKKKTKIIESDESRGAKEHPEKKRATSF